mmetsp:Transcript_77836/g.231892  ORF Transcript_77836/g.231892 Transcript_77836/m.231892 type:complete len:221 (-) Transcript_77836:9-671(-)
MSCLSICIWTSGEIWLKDVCSCFNFRFFLSISRRAWPPSTLMQLFISSTTCRVLLVLSASAKATAPAAPTPQPLRSTRMSPSAPSPPMRLAMCWAPRSPTGLKEALRCVTEEFFCKHWQTYSISSGPKAGPSWSGGRRKIVSMASSSAATRGRTSSIGPKGTFGGHADDAVGSSGTAAALALAAGAFALTDDARAFGGIGLGRGGRAGGGATAEGSRERA